MALFLSPLIPKRILSLYLIYLKLILFISFIMLILFLNMFVFISNTFSSKHLKNTLLIKKKDNKSVFGNLYLSNVL